MTDDDDVDIREPLRFDPDTPLTTFSEDDEKEESSLLLLDVVVVFVDAGALQSAAAVIDGTGKSAASDADAVVVNPPVCDGDDDAMTSSLV